MALDGDAALRFGDGLLVDVHPAVAGVPGEHELRRRVADHSHGLAPAEARRTIESEMESNQKSLILETLRQHNWNKGKTATALNINRTTLWRKMKKYGLNPKDKGRE